jgi:DNA-binding NtrC family response regulator
MARIGLYSEDRELQLLLSDDLGSEFQVLIGSNEDGIDHLLTAGNCDVLILDLASRRDSVQERVESARRVIASHVPLVVIADDDLQPAAVELVGLGACGYCGKPVSIRHLKAMLCRLCKDLSLKPQRQSAQPQSDEDSRCDGLIGASPQMRHVYQLVRKVTNVNAPVLVTGESGTGKELIARAIHNLGPRSNSPFVAVSCAAIPETLIEAELFGHEKGAFTGTVAEREGHFEHAGCGTLFLDEIGDLSLYAQVKLLRVMQQLEFSRLGSNRLIPLRARTIVATHQNLAEMVAQGKFRRDLYYRLNVVSIDAPPLREHPEDISQIAMHFIRHYSRLYHKSMSGIDLNVMAMLQAYSWPGNVRELEHVIQSAIILGLGERILAEDLPLSIQEENVNVVGIDDSHPTGSFERQLLDYKIRLAIAAVRENNGNKTLAARSLGISRAYLHRLIRLVEPDLAVEQNGPQMAAV